MLRLRTSISLSLLALAVGVAGTGWLSTLTSEWHGPPARFAQAGAHATRPTAWPAPRRGHGPVSVVQTRRLPRGPSRADRGPAHATDVTAAVVLQPLSTPTDSTLRWDQLRGHLDGRVLLQVEVDAGGDVLGAAIRESSGDPVLDQHALRSVRGWRFAVPAGHPTGLSGELPMRFSSRRDELARAR